MAVEKAPDAFRTISEVAQDLDVPQHVLRFWESRFREIRPMKRGGGRRYYRPDDIALLRGIRHLLYGQGYTIRGVQRLLREQGVRFVQSAWQHAPTQPVAQAAEGISDGAGERLDDGEHDHPPALPSIGGGEGAEPAPQRLSSSGAASAAAAPSSSLPREHVQRLRTVLHELSECRRLLDAAMSEGSADDKVGEETSLSSA
jgi:DNA-binding transcriptional MerR regulator